MYINSPRWTSDYATGKPHAGYRVIAIASEEIELRDSY
jgi:hypothetical protein